METLKLHMMGLVKSGDEGGARRRTTEPMRGQGGGVEENGSAFLAGTIIGGDGNTLHFKHSTQGVATLVSGVLGLVVVRTEDLTMGGEQKIKSREIPYLINTLFPYKNPSHRNSNRL